MKATRIAGFLFDNGEFFAAHLDDGGARVGMNGVVALDVPAGHELHSEILALTPATVESFIDQQIGAGRIDLRVFA
ncbi:hypothetical protein FX016_22945 [Cupriavidus gilardii]|nr:hypothetical protein FX016_22945 [Cupriavidus gilardii]